ncbi:LemA family protein [Cecembia lonarensis]|uniref:LemA family protein n=1 Tax=Cecembia lonarensis (strain CCUG 58316 / KCTC 22772 / LW9) TaxID=1225176 RepID=K1L417_CECL9|nr:LemA family protein [Cecembia lonarensis]EKB49566.1 LemA family protein [Cecembia lonarensis LW9]
MTAVIIVAVVLALGFYVVGIYNRLIKLRTNVGEAWSGIDVQLKKRYDLIPNLIETVKGFASHERETFESVTKARTVAMGASGVVDQQAAENQLTRALSGLFAVAERYPDLKSNTNFLQMQQDLSAVEQDIERSRRYYNGTVRDQNILIDSFPSNVIANSFGFQKSAFFELESESERAVPKVDFK